MKLFTLHRIDSEHNSKVVKLVAAEFTSPLAIIKGIFTFELILLKSIGGLATYRRTLKRALTDEGASRRTKRSRQQRVNAYLLS